MPGATEAKTPDRPLAGDVFRARLLEAVACGKAENTRFYNLLLTGRCPRRVLERFAQATWLSAELFCATLAELVEKAPDPEARLVMLENLLEEEGMFLRSSRGLISRPATSHPALARRFANSLDVDELDDAATHAIMPGRKLLAAGHWLEAVAHLLVGQELIFGEAAPRIAEALRINGLSAHDVAFFTVHEAADRKHGEQCLEIVTRLASGREQQDRCIAEAERGARAWVDAHGGPLGRTLGAKGH